MGQYRLAFYIAWQLLFGLHIDKYSINIYFLCFIVSIVFAKSARGIRLFHEKIEIYTTKTGSSTNGNGWEQWNLILRFFKWSWRKRIWRRILGNGDDGIRGHVPGVDKT